MSCTWSELSAVPENTALPLVNNSVGFAGIWLPQGGIPLTFSYMRLTSGWNGTTRVPMSAQLGPASGWSTRFQYATTRELMSRPLYRMPTPLLWQNGLLQLGAMTVA